MSIPTSGPRRNLGWPLLLLLVSLGVTGLAAFQAQRAARRHRATAEQLLRDYAAFAAWSYVRHAEQELQEAAWQVLNPILHRELHTLPGMPGAGKLVDYYRHSLDECGCEPSYRPASYFAWTLGTDTIDTAGAPVPPPLGRWVRDTLTTAIRHAAPPNDRMRILAGTQDGAVHLVAFGLMPTAAHDTVVYAFTFDPASLHDVFGDAVRANTLLPPAVTLGRANDSLLAVRVTTPGGAVLYESPGFPTWEYQADDVLQPRTAGLMVRASVRPELAAALTDGGVPSAGQPLLLGLVVLAAALSVVAVRQLRREEELARLRSDFVSSASHELRTPLAQIRLFAETLRLGRYSTEEQRAWLFGHIDRETTRLGHLVENVLHFSRIGQHPAPAPSPEPVDVSAELEQIVRAFAPLAASRRVTVRTELARGVLAPIDRATFRQLVLNLLDNAVKYGPPEQTVTVGLERAGAHVRVTVSDRGPGVPAAERDRIWEPFFRGSPDAVRAVGGSGIGLSIVRDAVRQHGGRAWLVDTPGGGATFTIELPAALPRSAEGAPRGETMPLVASEPG